MCSQFHRGSNWRRACNSNSKSGCSIATELVEWNYRGCSFAFFHFHGFVIFCLMHWLPLQRMFSYYLAFFLVCSAPAAFRIMQFFPQLASLVSAVTFPPLCIALHWKFLMEFTDYAVQNCFKLFCLPFNFPAEYFLPSFSSKPFCLIRQSLNELKDS